MKVVLGQNQEPTFCSELMTEQAYLVQLDTQVGGTYVPKGTTFQDDKTANWKGVVIAARRGYLVALALTRKRGFARTGADGFAVMVRFPSSGAGPQLQEAINLNRGLSSLLAKKTIKVTDSKVIVSWLFPFTKPKPEYVMSLLEVLLEEVSRYAPAFNGNCEDCGTEETHKITLLDGVPGYYCLSCQMRVTADKRREAEEYKAKKANYALGIVAGILAATIAGTAWGEAVAALEIGSDKWYRQALYGHMLVTFLIGWAVCRAVFAGMGKRDRVGQLMVVVLTLAAKWWGDVLYYTYLIADARHVSFTKGLVVEVLQNFFHYKLLDGMSVTVFGFDLAISAMLPWTRWGRLPTFEPVFQTVNPDGSLTQTKALRLRTS